MPANRWRISAIGLVLILGCTEQVPKHLANIGDSISQGFDANEQPADHPELSWIQGTDATVDSVFSRYRAIRSQITEQPESVTGAEMVAGDNNLAAQVNSVCAQNPLPESVWILLGGNDVCHRDPSSTDDATANMYSADTMVAAAHDGLTQLASCLPAGAHVHLLSVPRVDFVYQIGHDKGSFCPDLVWPAAQVCRIVTGEDNADRRAQIGARINDYNDALAQEVFAFNASVDGRNPQHLHVDSDWKGSIEDGHPNTSVGSIHYTADQINGTDCFHPNVEGQRRLACTAWENSGLGNNNPASCWNPT